MRLPEAERAKKFPLSRSVYVGKYPEENTRTTDVLAVNLLKALTPYL